jgi:hypothetical protein
VTIADRFVGDSALVGHDNLVSSLLRSTVPSLGYLNAQRTKGKKRPADSIGALIMVGRIATDEVQEKHLKPKKKIAPGARVKRAKKAAAR